MVDKLRSSVSLAQLHDRILERAKATTLPPSRVITPTSRIFVAAEVLTKRGIVNNSAAKVKDVGYVTLGQPLPDL